ncbi:MAG: methionine/alanine import family NSS transporter small subunit [Actinobacteria bacterium]|jgi:hypothetical protein|nr:methionine/alanine import family NSS transporter small subunit [Actinomycetota bacterium]
MTPTALVMMAIAMLTVWGGLIAGIVNLAKHPEEEGHEPQPPVEL